MEKIDFSDPTVREQLAKQYQPLVHKIVNQQLNKTALSPSDVLGFAEEGLVVAMNTYNPDKGQTFKQYAGYQILYAIQNGSNTQGHTVTFSAYMQKQAKEEGRSTWIMKSIDIHTDENGNEYCNIPVPSYEMSITDPESVYNELYEVIEKKFSSRDCKIFYQSFGLKHYKQHKGIELAKKYNCSGTNITLIVKKIINYIRTQPALMEELKEIMQNM